MSTGKYEDWIDDWRTDDEDVTLPKLVVAFAVFVLWLLVAFTYVVAFTPQ